MDEAVEDIIGLAKYIAVELNNPDAAHTLHENLKREIVKLGSVPVLFSGTDVEYRNYIIHKKVFQSYLIFYIVDSIKNEIYVLRVLKDRMDWQNMLRNTREYHMNN